MYSPLATDTESDDEQAPTQNDKKRYHPIFTQRQRRVELLDVSVFIDSFCNSSGKTRAELLALPPMATIEDLGYDEVEAVLNL